jgi:hypothetical protein
VIWLPFSILDGLSSTPTLVYRDPRTPETNMH